MVICKLATPVASILIKAMYKSNVAILKDLETQTFTLKIKELRGFHAELDKKKQQGEKSVDACLVQLECSAEDAFALAEI